MKHLKTTIAAAMATLLISSISMAAGQISTGTDGSTAPPLINASGTLAKYITFMPINLHVNLGDLGGAGLGTSLNTRTFASSQADPTSLDGPDFWVTSPATGNAAEIRFSSNSHLQLDIKNHAEMSNVNSVGAPVNPIDFEGIDTLPTRFRTWVKGSSVKRIKNSIVTVVTTDTANYKDLGLTDSGGPLAASYYWQPTLQFEHGPDSGVKLDVQVTRAGQNDHFGTYETSATLVWSDLD